jgi:hypothetical protein
MKINEVGYATPAMRYDLEARTVVFERRDPATGEVAFQIPSARALEETRSKAADTEVGADATAEPAIAPGPEPAPEAPAPTAAHRVSVFA